MKQLEKLREQVKNKSAGSWEEEHKLVFQALNEHLKENIMLQRYDRNLPINVYSIAVSEIKQARAHGLKSSDAERRRIAADMTLKLLGQLKWDDDE